MLRGESALGARVLKYMINIILQIISMVLCLVGILQVLVGSKKWKQIKLFYIAFYVGLFNYAASILAGIMLWKQEGAFAHFMLYFSYFNEAVWGFFLTAVVLRRILYHIDPERKTREVRILRRVTTALFFLQLAVLVGYHIVCYYFEMFPGNAAVHGDGVLVLLFSWGLSFCIAVYALIRFGKRLPRYSLLSFVTFCITTGIAFVMHFIFYGIHFRSLATAICALVVYLFSLNESAEALVAKERENEKLKVEVMLSQIQPHLIFNSLTAIKHLCRENSAAEKAVVDFSRYLRGNMDSLNSDEPIPFDRELLHTRAYLSLEKLRFNDALTVAYDIQCTSFSLPALTLQSLTENAVRHGVRGTKDGRGTVTIATGEYDDRYEVTVSDDGKGFDTSELPEPEAHIGINNVRYRLENMCGGTLTITSVEGRGTVAVISIMKE